MQHYNSAQNFYGGIKIDSHLQEANFDCPVETVVLVADTVFTTGILSDFCRMLGESDVPDVDTKITCIETTYIKVQMDYNSYVKYF